MRGPSKSTSVASIGFILISIVVLGGMAWVTVSTFELAKKNVGEEHDRKVSLAVGRIEKYTGGVLNSETYRSFFDYLALNVREPLAVYSSTNEDVADAAQVLLPSPLAMYGPPLDWIDLYFYVHPDGQVTSPQVPEEAYRWTLADSTVSPLQERQSQEALDTLQAVLSGIDLQTRTAGAVARSCALLGHANASERARADGDFQKGIVGVCENIEDAGKGSGRRPSGLRDAQVGYIPPAQCESQHIVTQNIRGLALPARSDSEDVSGELMEISLGPIAPAFWLEPPSEADAKVAFVRECYADADVFYQGFIGDWDLLRPRLLRLIGDLFPEADLVTVEEDDDLDPGSSKMHMINLPVRLSVPELPGGTSRAAWRSVRGVLVTGWAAALLVLVVAGWGVRNLVALTERRMQFAYTVTHELRTPLTTFRLYSDMLATGLVPEDAKQEYLETLNRESLRLSSLVEGVLEYSRLENHRVKLNPVDTDSAGLVKAIRDAVGTQCRQCEVEPNTLNEIPDHVQLRTDLDVINRICGVLINNACRHTRDLDDPVVLVKLSSENGKVYLDVIDSGPGVDRADLRTIFKPFRRGRKASTSAQGGIGLGLALARCWAGLLGGRLDLVARHHPERGGAHFRLTFPMEAPS